MGKFYGACCNFLCKTQADLFKLVVHLGLQHQEEGLGGVGGEGGKKVKEEEGGRAFYVRKRRGKGVRR